MTSILLNTMPKSGSAYLSKGLAEITGCELLYLGNKYALIDQINFEAAGRFCEKSYVSQNHLAPSPENLQIIDYFNMRMVLHLRDPRQAVLSWIHHLNRITGQDDKSEYLLYFVPRTPQGYFNLSIEGKIDWQLENYLPQLVEWTRRWVELADTGAVPILITQQEELRTHERSIYDSILMFYGFDLENYKLPDLPKNEEETHYRMADPQEWLATFTPAQINRATDMIPEWMLRRFNWEEGANRKIIF